MLVNFYRRLLPTISMSIAGILIFSSATLTAPSKAQLLSRKCTANNTVKRRQKDVSIGRQLYTTQFDMFASPSRGFTTSRIACDITKPQIGTFQTLELEMGIDDGRRTDAAIISIFFNGKEVINEVIQKGPIKKLSLDIKNVKSITIEVSSPRGANYIYFVKAELQK